MENKRIGSTVALIIFFAVVCFLCWLDMYLAVNIPQTLANPSMPDADGNATAGVVGTGFIALIMGLGLIFAFILSGFIILNSLICLGFSIRNTRVESNTVRGINILLSCGYAVAAALGIVAVVLLRVL